MPFKTTTGRAAILIYSKKMIMMISTGYTSAMHFKELPQQSGDMSETMQNVLTSLVRKGPSDWNEGGGQSNALYL